MSWQEIVVIIVAVLLVLTAFGRPVVSRIRRKKGKSGSCGGGACGSCGCGSCPYCGDKEHEDKTRSDDINKTIP